MCCCSRRAPPWFWHTGQLVWRRHVHLPPPSRHAIRATCMQLLPLVEMYCKWELEEDCSDLRALMFRYDSEEELESHDLGRSLLFMVREDGIGNDIVPRLVPIETPYDPFQLVRERLAAAGSAILGLQQQVQPNPPLLCMCNLPMNIGLSFNMSCIAVATIAMSSGWRSHG